MRVFLFFGYDGGKFDGFQSQPNKSGVMDAIIFACQKLGIDSKIVGSSRTDKGVHAINQVAHLDIPSFWDDTNKLKNKLNHILNPYIFIRKITVEHSKKHARFDAKKRLYRYICYTGVYNPLLSDYALFLDSFNIKAANQALDLFYGTHDFGFFKKTGSDTKNDIVNLFKADVYKYKNLIIFRFIGDRFLRSQIRMMMASVLALQKREIELEQIKLQIDKIKKSSTAAISPCGLYLSRVYY